MRVAVAVEHLDAAVAGVGDIDETLRVDRDASRLTELARGRAGLAPRADELAVLVELRDARVGAQAIGDVDVAGGVPRDVGRTVEHVLLPAGSGGPPRPRPPQQLPPSTGAPPRPPPAAGPRPPATRCAPPGPPAAAGGAAPRAGNGFRFSLAPKQHQDLLPLGSNFITMLDI